ncbi:MAG: hypothetical protein HKP48_00545 [Winogradskyella sp.]|uniref:hypothetical protein n=1 Tax=Winogradskyella sp. TaxID=1883156 RepID=UPI0017978897|nr:hypothetical protein [Winogradskyella sp.]MBT8244846.1 hypothetical protein [Winogradskyella sp.]NNK21804.1 hypothetical protein [Winogradskyella sp.]
MLRFKFLPKFSFIIPFAFVVFTIIGTQLHELGHIAVAKYYGYETALYHDSMTYYHKRIMQDEDYIKLKELYKKNKNLEYEEFSQNVKDEVEVLNKNLDKKYSKQVNNSGLYVTIGGPAQTILTSIIGFIILLYRRRKRYDFKLLDWIAVFLALFILREVFNFCNAVFSFLFFNQINFSGDEFGISSTLGFNQWLLPSVMLITGLILSLYVIFRLIPIKYRFSFIISGFIGGLLGYFIWFGFLGEWVFRLF